MQRVMRTTVSRGVTLLCGVWVALFATSCLHTAATARREMDTAFNLMQAAKSSGAERCDPVSYRAAAEEMDRASVALDNDDAYRARVHAQAAMQLATSARATAERSPDRCVPMFGGGGGAGGAGGAGGGGGGEAGAAPAPTGSAGEPQPAIENEPLPSP